MTDRLDRILRDDAARPIADDGFSARVMAALPARAPRTRTWLHPTLVFGSAALGAALALMLAPAGGSLLQGFADLVQWRGMTPAALTGIAMGAALLLSALVLAMDPE